MRTVEELIERCRVPAGERIKLRDHDPAWAGDKKYPKKERKRRAEQVLSDDTAALAQAQQLFYAADTYSILMILQGMDASGKDGTIKHVMSGVNPQGVHVVSFKEPSKKELEHDFLWRCSRALPERGQIGIFNRSYYEDVLVVRVFPELLKLGRVPGVEAGRSLWEQRYESINAFERNLVRNGTIVLKFFLHISKDEQRERFLERLDDPTRHWKFVPSDLVSRGSWDEFMEAYDDALSATNTKWAPWHIVPADRKWVSRALVAAIVSRAIGGLDLAYPEVTDEKRRQIDEARTRLRAETAD